MENQNNTAYTMRDANTLEDLHRRLTCGVAMIDAVWQAMDNGGGNPSSTYSNALFAVSQYFRGLADRLGDYADIVAETVTASNTRKGGVV